MSDIILKVENLSKQYRLGVIGSGTLRDDVSRWIAKVRGKKDPTLKIGDTNTLNTVDGKYVWALQDINFEVKQGEVLGIIGKNGAGKSTLLKVLSKVTGPTTGIIKAKGRIASLLEVGTGFHGELTGKENIFLNGAILGMTKTEIKNKLDEIIDFSGIAKYVDTPVKRYSSGMYVRLAFAVAAFLEPEILIVDEVLAVGDSEFQRKAIGKMQDVSQSEGRTVLFVSHNMGAVQSLCTKGVLLNSGLISYTGDVADTIARYTLQNRSSEAVKSWDIKKGSDDVQIISVQLVNKDKKVESNIFSSDPFYIEIEFYNPKDNVVLYSGVQLVSKEGVPVLSSANWASATLGTDTWSGKKYPNGYYKSSCKIPGNLLNENTYSFHVVIIDNHSSTLARIGNVLEVNIIDDGEMRKEYTDEWFGIIKTKLEWVTEKSY